MLTQTLKSYKVAGLFGLPSDDAYAVLQTQYALNIDRGTEKYKKTSDWEPKYCHFVSNVLHLNSNKTYFKFLFPNSDHNCNYDDNY